MRVQLRTEEGEARSCESCKPSSKRIAQSLSLIISRHEMIRNSSTSMRVEKTRVYADITTEVGSPQVSDAAACIFCPSLPRSLARSSPLGQNEEMREESKRGVGVE